MLEIVSLLIEKIEAVGYIFYLEKTVKEVEGEISEVYNARPNEVMRFLYYAQRKNNWDVFVELQKSNTVEDENGESLTQESWIKSKLGKISAIFPSMDLKRLLDNMADLRGFYNSFATLKSNYLAAIKAPRLKNMLSELV